MPPRRYRLAILVNPTAWGQAGSSSILVSRVLVLDPFSVATYVPSPMASAGFVVAFVLIRVPRGAPGPSDDACCAAIARDREQLRLPPPLNGRLEYGVAGPYEVTVNDTDLDEYTIWEK